MKDYSYLYEESIENDEIPLDKLAQLVKGFLAYERKIKDLEEQLKEVKQLHNQLGQEYIPNLLLQHGLSEIKLKTGEKIKIKQEINASIKDIESFVDFLTERGDEDIVKSTISMGILPKEIIARIKKYLAEELDLYPEVVTNINAQTLKKYIRELCGIGLSEEEAAEKHGDRFVPVQELPQSISVFTFFKTTIK